MSAPRRLLAGAVSGLALILTASVPALAVEDTRFVTVADPAGDLPIYGGTKIDRAEYAGLDLRRVRQRILDDRLVVVAKYRDLTKRNTRTNPDRTPIGASMSMFALYLDSHRRVSSHGLLYTASFGRDRQVELTKLQAASLNARAADHKCGTGEQVNNVKICGTRPACNPIHDPVQRIVGQAGDGPHAGQSDRGRGSGGRIQDAKGGRAARRQDGGSIQHAIHELQAVE
jgi:hypothetical protein